MKMLIQVRPQEGDSTNHCAADPIAQALRKAVGLPRCTAATARRVHAMAQPSRLFARGAQWMVKSDTPPAVRDWILKWDATGDGGSFDFEVEAVPVDVVSCEYLIPGAGFFGTT